MKKIVGILSAAAVLATSVFAADVSAGVRLAVDLFKYNTGSEDLSAITVRRENEDYHKPVSFSIGDEKAGGALHFTYKNGNTVLTGASFNKEDNSIGVTKDAGMIVTHWSIWVKPIDMLKVTVGSWSNTMNQEQIGYWRTESKIGADAGELVFTLAPIDGLAIDLAFAPGYDNAWLSKAKGSDASVAQLGLMAHYGADFGTISAMFKAENTFKNLTFGVGYSNTFDPVFMFVNVLGVVGPKWNDDIEFKKIRIEGFAKAGIDAFTAMLFLPVNINVYDGASAADKTLELGAVARFNYALDACTVFVEIEDSAIVSKDFGMSVKPGINGNIGACNIECRVELGLSKPNNGDFKMDIKVPVEFAISF